MMSIEQRSGWAPILPATQHYYSQDTAPCTFSTFADRAMYHGTGVPPQNHPARTFALVREDLPGTRCGHCGSSRVLVVTLQWRLIFASGAVAYDYEVVCRVCGHFTAFSRCRPHEQAPAAQPPEFQREGTTRPGREEYGGH
jgi:hypothetical protein